MRKLLRTLCIVAAAASVISCRAGRGVLPPTIASRHTASTSFAPSVAQWSSGATFAPSSFTVSWANAPAQGDVLIVALWNNGQTSGAANTYTPPAGWTLADQDTAETYATYQVFTHVAAAGEIGRYVFSPLVPQREHAWIAADVQGVSQVRTAANAFIMNSTTFDTPALDLGYPGDLAVALNLPARTNSVTWTDPNGWSTGIGPVSSWHAQALYQTVSSTTPPSADTTASADATGFSAIVVLAAPDAQATPSPSPQTTPTPISPAVPKQWASGAQYAPASIPVSWPAEPPPGDMLLVALWNNGQSSGAANTYTPPAGWTLAGEDSSTYATYEVFWHRVTAGETNDYVFTPLMSEREHAWMGADLANASAVETYGDNFVPSGTAYAPPTLTAAQPGDVAVVFNLPLTLNSVTWSDPAGWTLGSSANGPWHGETLYETLAGSTAAEESLLSASAPGFSGMVLVTSSAGTAPPTPLPTPTPTSLPTSTPASTDWSTFGYDLQRTGYNPIEDTIGTSSFGTLHNVWASPASVGNYLQGQPVVASNVSVGTATPTLLYAGAMSGRFYAFDTATGAVVWSKQLGTGSYRCPDGATGNWGVEGGAVLDRARHRIYVPDGANSVHALDLATGKESSGWPVSIAPVTSRDFIHAALTYNAANGLLYAQTSSPCDNSPWYGRIVAIDTAAPSVANTFYPNQGASGGSIWGVGGAAVDPSTNDVFVATGNADGSTQNANYSEHLVELTADLRSVIASSYPANMPFMYDSDFGATPLLFEPVGCPPLLAAVNKSGAFVLYNRTNISAGPIQEITMAQTGSEFRGVPSYDPVTGYVYVGLPDSQGIYTPGIAAFGIRADCTLNPTPVWSGALGTTKDQRSPITIANGVAYVGLYNENAVYAFDAATGTRLWSAALGGAGQIAPAVVNGRLYVGDVGGTIRAWAP